MVGRDFEYVGCVPGVRGEVDDVCSGEAFGLVVCGMGVEEDGEGFFFCVGVDLRCVVLLILFVDHFVEDRLSVFLGWFRPPPPAQGPGREGFVFGADYYLRRFSFPVLAGPTAAGGAGEWGAAVVRVVLICGGPPFYRWWRQGPS